MICLLSKGVFWLLFFLVRVILALVEKGVILANLITFCHFPLLCTAFLNIRIIITKQIRGKKKRIILKICNIGIPRFKGQHNQCNELTPIFSQSILLNVIDIFPLLYILYTYKFRCLIMYCKQVREHKEI